MSIYRTLIIVSMFEWLISIGYGRILESGPLAGVEVTSQWVADANEDCLEIEAGRIPKHAEPVPLEIRDGGSRVFCGSNYFIMLRKTSFPVLAANDNKILGYSYGYELYIGSMDLLEKYPTYRPIASKVWYISNAEALRLKNANRAALDARMPPLEKYYELRPITESPEPTKSPSAAGPSEPHDLTKAPISPTGSGR